jgi:hypothetical protein
MKLLFRGKGHWTWTAWWTTHDVIPPIVGNRI